MFWTIAAAVALIPLTLRFWAARSIRQRPGIWWWAFTLTFLGIISGAAMLTNQPAINSALQIPNVAYLLSNLGFTLAAGAVNVYVHCLRTPHRQPASGWIIGHGGVAAGIAVAILLGWLAAPIHTITYPNFRLAPATPASIAYDIGFHVYLGTTLANVAVCAVGLARGHGAARDPGRKIGGILIAAGAAIDVVAHGLYLARNIIQLSAGGHALHIGTVADILTLCSLISIGTGSITFVLVPRLQSHRRARHLSTHLDPLWQRLRHLYPTIALPGNSPHHRWSPAAAERKLIEIADGWRLLPIPPAHDTNPADAPQARVVDALIQPPADQDDRDHAVSVLPTAATRQDEENTALTVAHDYAHRLEYLTRAS